MRRAREFMKKDKAKKMEKNNGTIAIETDKHDKVEKVKEKPVAKKKEKPVEEPKKVEMVKTRKKVDEKKLDKPLQIEIDELEEDLEEEEDEDDFDGISDGDDDDDTDGLLIPLENGWVCEKRLADPETNTYSTHFWSPDGQRHSSLTSIKSYGTKKKLKLNMVIFERALKSNPHK